MTDLQIEMMVAMCAAALEIFNSKRTDLNEIILQSATEIHKAHCDLIGVPYSTQLTYTSKVSGQSFGLEIFEGKTTRLTDFSKVEPKGALNKTLNEPQTVV